MIKLFVVKIVILSFYFLFIFTLPAFSYVGPGAGFAFVGSFLFIFVAFFLAFFNFLTFPIRAFIKFLKRVKTLKNAKYKRVVIIGFDGVDYNLLNKFFKRGNDFQNMKKLAEQGTFAPLLSTEPPVSPVAWSTFATGVNPGKHNIFDFLTTDRNTYMPKLSCSDILPPKRILKLGKLNIPVSRPKIELKRKSKSFWNVVGSKGVFSTVLRVPFTFPPEKFYGLMLSGFGTPDLRGTQGSFSFYSDEKEEDFDISEGIFEKLKRVSEDLYEGVIKGPANPFRKENLPLEIKFQISINRENQNAVVDIGKEKFELATGNLSDWIRIEFKAGMIKIRGIVQMVLESLDPLKLYLSPINIDPEKPSMPISHPKIFSVYLSKLLGPYATLGMAEDTWALNERILSEEGFMQEVYNTQKEREKVFFDTFKKVKNGLIVQVFESTDRIQHMFWRYLKDSESPADLPSDKKNIINSIYDVYRSMDDFLGVLSKKIKKDDLLIIVSDHGFASFNREFHLNSWLHKEGYLVLKDGKTRSDKWYADVDWSKSKAYGQGLNGIYLNQKGREKSGIVNPGEEAERIKNEIKEKLKKLKDEKNKKMVMKAVYKREELYKGPYTENAPDIIVGYNIGYRLSWESAVNYVDDRVFSDNKRLWSGDHAFTSDQVPGIFFCNKKINRKDPMLMDISPTVLSAFGIKSLPYIDGRDLEVN